MFKNDPLLNRIWIDPARCGGKPCLRGHRIWVSMILDLFATGQSHDEVLLEFPQLERADILACLAYAAEMAREHTISVSSTVSAA